MRAHTHAQDTEDTPSRFFFRAGLSFSFFSSFSICLRAVSRAAAHRESATDTRGGGKKKIKGVRSFFGQLRLKVRSSFGEQGDDKRANVEKK